MKYKDSFYNVEVEHKEGRILVYNTYSQAISWFDAKTYSTFNKKKLIESDTLLPDIIRLGFCVPETEDETQKVLAERSKVHSMNEYSEYVIAPTMICNMQCEYCFENSSNRCSAMECNKTEAVIRFVLTDVDTKKPSKVHVRWFGGEPTLEISIIRKISGEIHSYMNNNGIEYVSSIISNGYLLNRDMAKVLAQKCYVTSAQVSLDGLRETYAKVKGVSVDVFDQVVENICEASEFLKINVRLNTSRKNIDEMLNLVLYLLDDKQLSGRISINFAYVRSYDFNDQKGLFGEYDFEVEREKLLVELIERGYKDSLWLPPNDKRLFFCPVTSNNSITIGPQMELYSCECLLGRQKHVLGDCINGIVKPNVDYEIRNYPVSNSCKKCNLLPACGLGCAQRILVENEEQDCNAVRQRIYSNVRLYLKAKTSK